jgi:DNA-binding FadR family transcriptional regulator
VELNSAQRVHFLIFGISITQSAEAKDQAYIQFHRQVGRSCGNPIYAMLMENLMDFTEGFMRAIKPVTTLIHHEHDHDDIIAAIESRKPDKAARLAKRHASHILGEMKKLEILYLEQLEKEVSSPGDQPPKTEMTTKD